MKISELLNKIQLHFSPIEVGLSKYQDYKGVSTIDFQKSLKYHNVTPFEALLNEIKNQKEELSDFTAVGGSVNISGGRFYVKILCKNDTDFLLLNVHQGKPIQDLKNYFDDIAVLVGDHTVDLNKLPVYKSIYVDDWSSNKMGEEDIDNN